MTEKIQIIPLACKNCGAVPNVFLGRFDTGNLWFVKCTDCGYTGPRKTDRNEAVFAWNNLKVEGTNN